MTLRDERTEPPDVDRLARSMLQLLGEDGQHDTPPAEVDGHRGGSWSKAPDFASNPTGPRLSGKPAAGTASVISTRG